jgi:hypothetical protein
MIIGVSGQAGAGKDTVGSILVRDHGFVSIAFADPMKRFCAQLFDWDEERLWGASERRNEPDPRYRSEVVPEGLNARRALQLLGTEVGRNCYPGVWVEYALRLAKELDGAAGVGYDRAKGVFPSAAPPIKGVVITDVRFRNELEAVRAIGGEIWRVTRPGSGLEGVAAMHQSEAEMASIPDDDFDEVIRNEGTLEYLRAYVHAAIRR